MYKIIGILTMVLTSHYLLAQNIEVGAEFSYGKTSIDEGHTFENIFEEGPLNNINLGFSVSSNPHKSVLFINSGMLYHRVYDEKNSFNFIKLPIGMDLVFGKKLKLFFGGGAYLNWLFLTRWNYYAPPDLHNFQLGLYCDLGLRYQVDRFWSILLKFRMEFDQTLLYSLFEDYDYWTHDYGVVIGFKYLIPSKNAKNN
jgi:hypothetical protein